MRKLISKLLNPLSPAEMARQQYVQTQRDLLEAETHLEYVESRVEMLHIRMARLKDYIEDNQSYTSNTTDVAIGDFTFPTQSMRNIKVTT